ncbi:DUF4446 family protein [Patescibacteria group bacterium]|nr:DUF4446 family protein [Patescibacteria group bacterium]
MFATILTTINLNPLLALIILVALIFLAWNLTLHWQVYQTGKKIKLMFKGTKVADLEGVIFEQIKRLRQTEKNLAELTKFSRQVEKMAQSSIQKVGVIRFNPFSDTGGDQSFSIACLDAQDNGFTLTSLFTREGTRIYTKPIINNESKYPLTEEEKRAIGEAIGTKNKSKVKNQKSK